ncbi:hypothetical protein TNCV_2414531 [Trichonephila clavipes]|nr:hypothetical protein TNCV_2414531 [Trichonephila clavipes]
MTGGLCAWQWGIAQLRREPQIQSIAHDLGSTLTIRRRVHKASIVLFTLDCNITMVGETTMRGCGTVSLCTRYHGFTVALLRIVGATSLTIHSAMFQKDDTRHAMFMCPSDSIVCWFSRSIANRKCVPNDWPGIHHPL